MREYLRIAGRNINNIRYVDDTTLLAESEEELKSLLMKVKEESKCLLISWLQSPSAVSLEPRKIKSATVSPSVCHEVMGPDAMILVF